MRRILFLRRFSIFDDLGLQEIDKISDLAIDKPLGCNPNGLLHSLDALFS
jgi:hypothetical protein